MQRRPQIGEYVHVGDLPGVFRVIDRDGGLYVLESHTGARCRAGVWTVRFADRGARAA